MKKTHLIKIIQEEITTVLSEASYAGKGAIPQIKKDPKFSTLSGDGKANAEKELKSGGTVELEEDQLDEMAKITGRLETAIKKVIAANKYLEGLPLKKAIKADDEVEDALEGDTMYDNQLNKFIALVRGNREVGARGRKADPNKPATKSTPKPKTPKVSTAGMDDEEKEAAKAAGSDSTAKELGKTVPTDKIEKFNTGLKFIKKYKDDKAIIDAYLKKAKEEYKLPVNMIKDLKKAAGRDVGI